MSKWNMSKKISSSVLHFSTECWGGSRNEWVFVSSQADRKWWHRDSEGHSSPGLKECWEIQDPFLIRACWRISLRKANWDQAGACWQQGQFWCPFFSWCGVSLSWWLFLDGMGKWPLTPAVDHRVSRTRPEFSIDLFRKGIRRLIENEDYFSQQYYRMFPLSIVSYGSFQRGKGGWLIWGGGFGFFFPLLVKQDKAFIKDGAEGTGACPVTGKQVSLLVWNCGCD